MNERGEAAPLHSYPIQLVDAHCVRSLAERTPRPEVDLPDELGVRVLSSELSPDAKSFACRLEVAGAYPVHDTEAAHFEVVIEGIFASPAEIASADYVDFTAATPLVLLWPYARAYIADLGRMLGVSLPILPTLDALTPRQPPEGDSQDAEPD